MSRVAVVQPTALVGRELRERLEQRPDLVDSIALLSIDPHEIGTVTDNLGGAAFVTRAEPASFDDVDLVFFCGAIESDREVLALLPEGTRAVLLSRGVTTSDAPFAVAGLVRAEELPARVASPHPAAVALALVLAPLRELGLRRAHATAILPVSASADEAVEELFEQTRSLLGFAGGTSERFGGQVAFNLIPATIDPKPLVDAVAAALGAACPRPSLHILQAGIFHSVALSIWVEIRDDPGADGVRSQLARADGVALSEDAASLGPVAAASEEKLLVGDPVPAGEPGAYWLWAAMDNFGRGAALNGIGLAELLLDRAPQA